MAPFRAYLEMRPVNAPCTASFAVSVTSGGITLISGRHGEPAFKVWRAKKAAACALLSRCFGQIKRQTSKCNANGSKRVSSNKSCDACAVRVHASQRICSLSSALQMAASTIAPSKKYITRYVHTKP